MEKYFNNQKEYQNPRFLSNFHNLSFNGFEVLDLGCGHGALTIDIAERGAKNVVGIDLNKTLIEFANKNLITNYFPLRENVKFVKANLRDLYEYKFDIIISKNTFEHIVNLDKLLLEIKERLKISGRLLAGFGPLYHSPWGDHNILRHKLPWVHIFLIKKYLRKKNLFSIKDLDLNGLSINDYERIFNNINGLKIINFETNIVNISQNYCLKSTFYPPFIFYKSKIFLKIINKIFKAFSTIHWLKKFFIFNVFLIMQRVE
ncbi:MAG: class I SAM-dependent methyltransferase [Candidatus Odinarchaeota archaeon]